MFFFTIVPAFHLSSATKNPHSTRDWTEEKISSFSSVGKIDVAFSPGEESTRLIVQVIDSAKTSIRLAAYSFTSKPIAEALVAAHNRGVDVQAVLDKSNKTSKYTSATFLSNQGIPTRIDGKHPIAHSKYMVVDGTTVQTGSFNYTKAAKRNAENVVVFWSSPDIAKTYMANWQHHWEHAETFPLHG